MSTLKDIKQAFGNSEGVVEKSVIVYKAIVTLLIIFPMLYLAGFITGCLWLINPHEAGIECIEGLF